MSGFAYTLGRIFIPVIFLVSGIRKFMDVKGVAGTLSAKGLPVPEQLTAWTGLGKYEALGYLVAAIEVVGGFMVLVGLGTRIGALALFLFTLGTIFVAHDFWNMEGAAAAANQAQALKNLSIMGGLLLLVSGGAGPHSVDARKRA